MLTTTGPFQVVAVSEHVGRMVLDCICFRIHVLQMRIRFCVVPMTQRRIANVVQVAVRHLVSQYIIPNVITRPVLDIADKQRLQLINRSIAAIRDFSVSNSPR